MRSNTFFHLFFLLVSTLTVSARQHVRRQSDIDELLLRRYIDALIAERVPHITSEVHHPLSRRAGTASNGVQHAALGKYRPLPPPPKANAPPQSNLKPSRLPIRTGNSARLNGPFDADKYGHPSHAPTQPERSERPPPIPPKSPKRQPPQKPLPPIPKNSATLNGPFDADKFGHPSHAPTQPEHPKSPKRQSSQGRPVPPKPAAAKPVTANTAAPRPATPWPTVQQPLAAKPVAEKPARKRLTKPRPEPVAEKSKSRFFKNPFKKSTPSQAASEKPTGPKQDIHAEKKPSKFRNIFRTTPKPSKSASAPSKATSNLHSTQKISTPSQQELGKKNNHALPPLPPAHEANQATLAAKQGRPKLTTNQAAGADATKRWGQTFNDHNPQQASQSQPKPRPISSSSGTSISSSQSSKYSLSNYGSVSPLSSGSGHWPGKSSPASPVSPMSFYMSAPESFYRQATPEPIHSVSNIGVAFRKRDEDDGEEEVKKEKKDKKKKKKSGGVKEDDGAAPYFSVAGPRSKLRARAILIEMLQAREIMDEFIWS